MPFAWNTSNRLMTTLGFTSSCLQIDETADRINNIVAVIFTVLSLRFSLAEGLSNVNYMTAMDKYTTICMLLLVWLTMYHAGVSGVTRRLWANESMFEEEYEETVNKVDVGFFWVGETSLLC